MTKWEFFDNHWFLAFLAICFGYGIFVRIVRILLILLRGWPPTHLDADGDFRRAESNDEEAKP